MKQTQPEARGLTRTDERHRISAAASFRGQASRGRLAIFALKHNEQGNFSQLCSAAAVSIRYLLSSRSKIRSTLPSYDSATAPVQTKNEMGKVPLLQAHVTPLLPRIGGADEKAGKTTRKKLHLSLSTQLAYDDDSLSPARLIPPKPLARKHEKNGGNPVRRNSTRYKIRCENRGRSRPRVRLESTADTSTEYLHQLAAPQASSTAFDLNFERPRLTEDEDGASSTQGEAAAYLIAGILTKDGVLRRTRSSTKCPERAGGRDDGTQMYMQ
ncbi:hypothetical protein CCMA1212_009329 [Trichoderma ghanense]|uniref:Uncharacterized protein n=1 Tax=Trichoderma ghanense TaxID=65468 RepID=A0ABY2GS63_9HYPO